MASPINLHSSPITVGASLLGTGSPIAAGDRMLGTRNVRDAIGGRELGMGDSWIVQGPPGLCRVFITHSMTHRIINHDIGAVAASPMAQ